MSFFDFYNCDAYDNLLSMSRHVEGRLKEKKITIKNVLILWERIKTALIVCRDRYNDIGYVKKKDYYNWAEKHLGILYESLKYYESGNEFKSKYYNDMVEKYIKFSSNRYNKEGEDYVFAIDYEEKLKEFFNYI